VTHLERTTECCWCI